ncbi:WxcM-like domain-containing protein [Roseateles sp. DB2]|uniref:WxcM-like domain-containing protein n=1 Tax=Roseateles sp. DB2 TaxID=3453717 RepID=UPI003EEA4CDA
MNPTDLPDVFIHSHALVESPFIGPGSCIGAFAHVLPGARLGEDAEIGDHALIDGQVQLGSRVRVRPGAQLWAPLVVEDDACIGPNTVFSGSAEAGGPSRVGAGAVIGANATIRSGLSIGPRAQVQDGAVVTRDVPPHAIVSGNPAHIVGYVDTPHLDLPATPRAASQLDAPPALHVAAARLVALPKIVDLRGALSFGEIGVHLPFTPQRFFMVYDVPSKEVRGEHAHKACHQFLVCVKGSVSVVLDDGQARDEVTLDSARMGLHIPPMVWGIQYQFSPDAVLLVLASDTYAADDYIREYEDFLAALGRPGA